MSAAINAAQGDAAEQIRALCPDGADIVMESSSSKAGVELANKVIRQPLARVTNTGYPQAELHSNPHYWPRLVYQANYTHKVETAPGELTGGEGAIILKPGDRTVADRLAVMERVRKGELPLADIVTAPTPVEEAPQAYFALRDHPEKYNTLVFKW
jgi:threonine dehydrogenase-like Zn-dependent dehydrogenase